MTYTVKDFLEKEYKRFNLKSEWKLDGKRTAPEIELLQSVDGFFLNINIYIPNKNGKTFRPVGNILYGLNAGFYNYSKWNSQDDEKTNKMFFIGYKSELIPHIGILDFNSIDDICKIKQNNGLLTDKSQIDYMVSQFP